MIFSKYEEIIDDKIMFYICDSESVEDAKISVKEWVETNIYPYAYKDDFCDGVIDPDSIEERVQELWDETQAEHIEYWRKMYIKEKNA